MVRIPKARDISSVNATDQSLNWTVQCNKLRKEGYTFKDIALALNISETNARRYYYGIHHTLAPRGYGSYTQIRIGSCCPINL
jgi:DNA-binding NarL/FixJ family response regulator